MEHFPQKLKFFRRASGFSQEDLGDRIGRSQARIAALETGRATPSEAEIRLLAEVLSLPCVEAESCASK